MFILGWKQKKNNNAENQIAQMILWGHNSKATYEVNTEREK